MFRAATCAGDVAQWADHPTVSAERGSDGRSGVMSALPELEEHPTSVVRDNNQPGAAFVRTGDSQKTEAAA